jgi:hypothetical protein
MSCAVLHRIVQLSEPVSLSDTAWDFLGTSPNVRRYPGDWQSLLSTLEEEFSTEQLRAAKVTLMNDEGEPEPSPVLSELTQAFVCLRRKKNERPYDLLTERGSLMCDDPPCFAARGDWYTNVCSRKFQNLLFVVRDVRALAVLRLLCLPVTLANGLSELSGNQMRQLCGEPELGRRVIIPQCDNLPEVKLHDTTLVLVAWDVTGLSIQGPGNVMTTAVWLAQMAETFGFKTERIQLLKPTDAEVHEIALAAELRDAIIVRATMQSILEDSEYDLREYFTESRRPEEYGDARRELKQAIERARDRKYQSPELMEKRNHLIRVFNRTCLQPLYAEADSTEDPAARTLWLAAAETSERLHVSNPLLRVAAHAGSRDDDPQNDSITPDESKERRQLIAQLVDIRRELRSKEK